VVRNRIGVRTWCIRDDDMVTLGGSEVDIVYANSIACDDLQVRRDSEMLLGNRPGSRCPSDGVTERRRKL
jgi:hypothetical protein